eukprot:CAMPEP_0167773380 /NCGR_PEP_ID=MMETSP0111_2-20121227/1385_1 /TAXON_ID=91324 /ORGANISM="Lotharella globosa, Strain CCCM811" /LENGTH=393 /DNA_ID=CAMNT_0007663005 /DNA_START=16 /DNA_END=1197 /DNA_ORIENTATION=+
MQKKRKGKLTVKAANEMNQTVLMQMLELRGIERKLVSQQDHNDSAANARKDSLQLSLYQAHIEKGFVQRDINQCQQLAFTTDNLGLASKEEFASEAPDHLKVVDGRDEHTVTSNRLVFEVYRRGALAKTLVKSKKRKHDCTKLLAKSRSSRDSMRKHLKTIIDKAKPIVEKLKDRSGEGGEGKGAAAESAPPAVASEAYSLSAPLYILYNEALIQQHNAAPSMARVVAIDIEAGTSETPEGSIQRDLLREQGSSSNNDNDNNNSAAAGVPDVLHAHPVSLVLGLQWQKDKISLEFRYHPMAKIATVRLRGKPKKKAVKNVLDNLCKSDKGDTLLKDICQASSQNPTSGMKEELNGAYGWVQMLCGLASGKDVGSTEEQPGSLREVLQRIAECL